MWSSTQFIKTRGKVFIFPLVKNKDIGTLSKDITKVNKKEANTDGIIKGNMIFLKIVI